MPDLNFRVEGAEAVAFTAAPLLHFKLAIADAAPEPSQIHSVLLHCQIRIEPARRRYTPQEQPRLLDLFGEPHRWGQTLRNMLWTQVDVAVPSFTGSTRIDLPVPCTFDFNVAGTKYFQALEEGEVPLLLLFSGTIFHAGAGGPLQVMRISWEKEATYRLPVRVWREMMDLHYPNTAWLCLRRDVFDRLYQHKVRHGLPTWEQAVQSLLPAESEPVRP